MRLTAACVGAMAKKKRRAAFLCVSAKQEQEERRSHRTTGSAVAEQFLEDPTRWWDKRRQKGNSGRPEFNHLATGECRERWNATGLAAELKNMLDAKVDPANVQREPGRETTGALGMTSSGDQVCVEHLWEKYFKDPKEWWDNRNDKPLPKSADFRHKNTKEALWVASSTTPQWVRDELERDVLVSNAVGGSSGSSTNATYGACIARNAGDTMLLPGDAFSWTTRISRCTKLGQGRQALRIYKEMKVHGVKPSSYTFVAALKACSGLRDLESAKQIHAEVMESGFGSDVYVGTMLIDVYGKCGSLVDARHVFDKMPHRDVVSWSAMILGYAQIGQGQEALQLYEQMQQEGIIPDDRTFVGALKACGALAALQGTNEADGVLVKTRCLEKVRSIHSQILKRGPESDVFVGTTLVDVYAKCGNLGDARHVFDKMPHRTVVSWNAMIMGYAQMEKGKEALQLYGRMQQEGVVPDDVTFVGALKACSNLATLGEGGEVEGKLRLNHCLLQVRAIHSQITNRNVSETNLLVANMLVDAYSKCGSLVDARLAFEKIPRHDVVSWNAMILGYAQMDEGEEALKLYVRMQQEAIVPDERTYVGALKACSSLASMELGIETDGKRVKERCLEQVRSIHSKAVMSGCESVIFVATMLVDAYVKCGILVDARHVFEKMPRRDVFLWNIMILGYAQMEEGEEALQLFSRMQQEGLVPNDRTFVAALKACGSVAELEIGKELHTQITRSGLEGTDLFLGNGLVDMYGKCGSMGDAQKVFDGLTKKDVVTWNALVVGYARQGESHLVFDLFERMRPEAIQPNSITFLTVLNVCSHVGLVDRGKKYFEAMSGDYGIAPTIEHYSCMVDLLGRAGQLDKAMQMVTTMPFQPPVEVWRCVLAACRKWKNVELGRQAFEHAVRLDENDSAAYVLMSNIYAAAHMQKDARQIHAMRVKAKAWKQPGQSWWTDTCGKVHSFVVCDQEHPESQDIYAKLSKLVVKMKEKGYVPQLDCVLQDIPDDRKEDALCGHSEKLAISYALLKTPKGTTIRVMKNLRVCEDCHRAIALISDIEQRTIICRDASRFHVYKDGKCSCGNYW